MFETSMTGDQMLRLWLWAFVAIGLIAAIATGWLKARKIQPRGFTWKRFGFEALVAAISIPVSGFLLGGTNAFLTGHGLLAIDPAPAAWWRIAIEYAAYFFLFDTWFYWLHRAMHNEPFYFLIHKLHHKSTSTNMLTTLSVNPLESFVNGGFVPLFLTACTLIGTPVSAAAAALILPTNIIMGLYVHSGYELFPRWWNKSWASKWFITATFHDQHHRYFTINFGGYTTIWDRLCGTMRPKFEADYLAVKDRAASWRKPVEAS